MAHTHFSDRLWDVVCAATVVGIWPRFIEPNILSATRITLPINNLSKDLHGLKILQFSDLHWHAEMSPKFLNKIVEKAEKFAPDLIVFTGDALCYSLLPDPEPLQDFLSAFHAPYGCYAVLGNHDYQSYVTVNGQGDYDVSRKPSSHILKGWKRLLKDTKLTSKVTQRAKDVPLHQQLVETLNQTPFELLHNTSKIIPIKNSRLNICGLGEHTLGRTLPEEAFRQYDTRYPGIILLHNPDGLPSLKNYPGDIVLCGHTHGGQVDLPWLWNKFTAIENTALKKGLKNIDNRWVYINRGTGSTMPFRWFSIPEILCLTLEERPV